MRSLATFTPAASAAYKSVSSSSFVTVTQAAQTISFTAPVSPVIFGVAPITLAASGGASGSDVTFTATGPGTVNGSTLTITGAGTVVITAVQAATNNYAAAPAVSQSILVNKATQTITFTAPVSPVTFGVAPIALIASGGPSGKSITFTVTGPATVSGATLTITGAGTVVVTAAQASDSNYLAAAAVSQTILVNKAAQAISFPAPASPVTFGVAPITLVAPPGASGNTITFTATGPATVSGSTLAITGAGTVVVTARESAGANYTAAPPVSETILVRPATPDVTIASSINPVLASNPITFTATVTSTLGTPTGSVTFLDRATTLSSSPLTAGVASFTTKALAGGSHTITAVYAGSTNFAATTSSAIAEVVQDFDIAISTTGSGNSTSATAVPGGTAVYSFILSPTSSVIFPVPVDLSASGLPAGATATFSPSTIAAGSKATTVTMTIQLAAPAAALQQHSRFPARRVAPFTLALLLLPFGARLRRPSRRLRRGASLLLLLVLGAAAMASTVGCGSQTGFFGQPPANFTVTVTGTSGTLSHSTTFTLTVE